MNPSNQNAFNNTLVGYMRAYNAIYNNELRIKRETVRKIRRDSRQREANKMAIIACLPENQE